MDRSRTMFRVFDSVDATSELKQVYTKSCRDIVRNCRKSSNPRPGPIPSKLPLKGVLDRMRGQSARSARRNLYAQTEYKDRTTRTINSNASTVKVNSLFD